MDFDKIISELKKKIYKPVYILMGKEPYYIDLICNYISDNVLEDNEKDFNQTIFYGKDCNGSEVVETAKRFPMMANYQVVIVKELQSNDKKTDFYERIQKYIENPLNSTVLVICFKYDKITNTKLLNAAKKIGCVFDSKEIYENKLSSWIDSYVKSKGYSIDLKSSVIIAQNIGSDLTKIVNELNKLFIALGENSKKISPEIIETNIGISKEYNVYELQNTIGKRDIQGTLKIINYFSENEKTNPFIKINNTLFTFFEKLLKIHSLEFKNQTNIAQILGMHPFLALPYVDYVRNYNVLKVYHIIGLIREYDLKAKGVDSNSVADGQLLKELVFKIFNY